MKTRQIRQNFQKRRIKIEFDNLLSSSFAKKTRNKFLTCDNVYWPHRILPTSEKKPVQLFPFIRGGKKTKKLGFFGLFAKFSGKFLAKGNMEESIDTLCGLFGRLKLSIGWFKPTYVIAFFAVCDAARRRFLIFFCKILN